MATVTYQWIIVKDRHTDRRMADRYCWLWLLAGIQERRQLCLHIVRPGVIEEDDEGYEEYFDPKEGKRIERAVWDEQVSTEEADRLKKLPVVGPSFMLEPIDLECDAEGVEALCVCPNRGGSVSEE